jgi:hypothetical protein
MYLDDPRIICLPIPGENWYYLEDLHVFKLNEFIKADKIYRVGFEKARRDWDVSFYDCVGIPFEKRWSMFKCYRDTEKELNLESIVNPNRDPFVLLHDTGSNISYNIQLKTDLKIIKVKPVTNCLMDWCGIIEKASEIYCIDSSLIHLCQSLGVSGIFVAGFKNNSPFVLLPSWKQQL